MKISAISVVACENHTHHLCNCMWHRKCWTKSYGVRKFLNAQEYQFFVLVCFLVGQCCGRMRLSECLGRAWRSWRRTPECTEERRINFQFFLSTQPFFLDLSLVFMVSLLVCRSWHTELTCSWVMPSPGLLIFFYFAGVRFGFLYLSFSVLLQFSFFPPEAYPPRAPARTVLWRRFS